MRTLARETGPFRDDGAPWGMDDDARCPKDENLAPHGHGIPRSRRSGAGSVIDGTRDEEMYDALAMTGSTQFAIRGSTRRYRGKLDGSS